MTTSPTPCRCGPEGCADSACPGRRALSPADALDAMRHQLDPVDDWREPLERAAAELRRLAAVEAAYDGKAHELVVLEDAFDRLTDARDQLIEEQADLRADRDRLAAEVAEWQKLRDPAVLHANLLRGLPAQLTLKQVWHLAADDRVRLGDLEAEVEALRQFAEHVRACGDTRLASMAIAVLNAAKAKKDTQ